MINELKSLISKGRIEEALEKMLKINLKKQHKNEIVTLSSWFQRTLKKEDLGLSKENENYQKITKSLLSIIDDLDSEKTESFSELSKKHKKKSAGTKINNTKVKGDSNITIVGSKISGGLNKK